MKITGFCPMIVTEDAEKLVELFKELGFEHRHTKEGIEGGRNTNYAMVNEAGHRIAVASSQHMPKDLTAVNINVDDFEEAYQFFIDRGFVNPRGDRVTETGSSKSTLLFSPSGFAVNITEHIKK